MPHFAEEQISAYLDKQLGPNETRALELHLNECASCRTICSDMRDLTNLFRDAERLEPSPFLWSRIAAGFNNKEEHSSAHGWGASIITGLRTFAWNPGLAASVLAVLMIAGIAVYREVNTNIADRAMLAEIDRAFQSQAAQDPDSYNPFSSVSSSSSDANPFRNMRLRGRLDSEPPMPARH